MLRSIAIGATLLLLGLSAPSVFCEHLFIDLSRNASEYAALPRFWTNSGFSPAAPLPFNRSQIVAELNSNDVHRNMDYVSAMPNSAVRHMRIHWLLSLVEFRRLGFNNIPVYNFDDLDRFLDHLDEVRLLPVIEFMGLVFPRQRHHDTRSMWKDFTYQLVTRYLTRYGQRKLSLWRFELWNEPDLHTYNILNFTLTEYMEYVTGVSEGLAAAARRTKPTIQFRLQGPAGLFKSTARHAFCWGLLEKCNASPAHCPIDVITFHRKGLNNAAEIVANTQRLVARIHHKYPNLEHMPYANTECDPFAGWSKGVPFNGNVYYAHALTSIVFDHWQAIRSGRLAGLEFISHDNSFLSYHPHEFDQRTLLARFAMNHTRPHTVHFVQKPVYAALGVLAKLAEHATAVSVNKHIRYLISQSAHYVAAILLSGKATRMHSLRIQFDVAHWTNTSGRKFAYFAEYLHENQTDPHAIWVQNERPAYPNVTVLAAMHRAQGPHILRRPKIVEDQSHFKLRVKLHHPWVILVRVCSNLAAQPGKVENLRVELVDKQTILLLWHDRKDSDAERCIRSYEVFYATTNDSDDQTVGDVEWTLLTRNKHLPFLSYCHANDGSQNSTLAGFYKVRAVDLFGRFGDFSDAVEYKQ